MEAISYNFINGRVYDFKENTDSEWEEFGKSNPYYGVLASDKYQKENLTKENRSQFFQSGDEFINNVLQVIRSHFYSDFRIENALDFGCGVGRLTIPLAKIANHVDGIDISESMLNESKRNCALFSITNVDFKKMIEELSPATRYDLIVSYIVFQHINQVRGLTIVKQLISRLKDGGVCCIQFTYERSYRISKKIYYWLRVNVPGVRQLVNILKGRNLKTPFMQMNSYNLNTIFNNLQKAGIRDTFCTFSERDGYSSIIVYGKKG